jgi:hypothetical protein
LYVKCRIRKLFLKSNISEMKINGDYATITILKLSIILEMDLRAYLEA